jgi:hypothetical protein
MVTRPPFDTSTFILLLLDAMGTHGQSSSSQLVLFALGEHTFGAELGR